MKVGNKNSFCERLLESFQKRALNIGIKCRSQYTHSESMYVGRGREGKRTATFLSA